MSGFSNAVVGGMDILKRNAIRSLNFVAGVTGWTINKDGTAQFNQLTLVIQANGAAVLIYFPTGGLGNLIGSWSADDVTDQYGNDVPAGLNVNGGILNSVTLNGASILASTITSTLLNAVTIANSNLVGGTSYEQTITFDTGGGLLIGYSSTTTTVTQTANGTYTQTLPAGVTVINNPFCWGAGAGGDGGSTSVGGNGGGAGEFGGETSYTPSVNPFTYVVGNGGNNSSTGQGHGTDGGDSFIDNGGVFANGGNGDGTPGTGSTNTIHHDGGSGGASNANSGAASGGNSANPTAAGNSGIAPSGSGGAASPSPQSLSGTGGAGGANGANGSNGTAPGAGGGGAGKGTNSTGSKTVTYEATYTGSYYGPDANGGAPPNGLRSTSTLYQGGETASGGAFNGNMRSIMAFNRALIASDFAGYTITGCVLKLVNQHSWFNAGMTFTVDEFSGLPGSAPGSYPSGDLLHSTIATGTIAEGATHSYQLGAALGQRFATGATNGLGLGNSVPGSHAYDLNYYGWFAGGHGTSLEITITGTQTVAGSNSSGTGADGKVSFSFTTGQTMVFGLSAIVGSDASSNAFGVGYTGPLSAIQPGSAPAVVETWHSMTLTGGWTVGTGGIARYKFNGENTVSVEMTNIAPGTITDGTAIWTIPTGYVPTNAATQNFTLGMTYSAAPAYGSHPIVVVRSTGTMTILNFRGTITNFSCIARYVLD